MKKFFSLVLALVMALSLTTVAWGAGVSCGASCTDDTHVAAIGDTHYTSLKEAVADVAGVNAASGTALNAATEIVLLKDTKDSFDVGKSTGSVAKNIVLNLNNNTLTLGPGVGSTGTKTQGIRVLAYSQLEVKNGEIVCSDVASDSVKVAIANYGTLTLTNVDVNAGPYVLYTINNSGDLTLDGTTSVENGQDGAKLAIAHSVYNLYYTNFDASITIDSEDVVVGAIGVERSASSVNSGDIVLNISAGSFESVTDITDPAETDIADTVGNITGGTFGNNVPDAFLADGLELTQKADGTYTTNPDTAGSTTAALYDLKKANAAGDEVKGDIGYEVVAANKDETSGYTTGTLEYVKMDGKLFVKIAAADATTSDFYVTKANEKTAQFYLKQIDSVADITYDFVAVEFTNFGYKCDQLNASYVDYVTNEVGYYVWTHPVTDEKIYFADDVVTTGDAYYNKAVLSPFTVNILVDDEVVEAYAFVDNAVSCNPIDPLNQHTWSPVAYDKTTPVKAQCGICGTQATVYKNNKAPAGSDVIDVTFNQVPYDLVIVSAGGSYVPVVPSTPGKVESAATFDAGITMYVGMSVMAAAGSAVVIGKKKD